jgi:integrase
MPGHIRKRGKRKDGSTVWQARHADPTRPSPTAKVERSFRTKQEAEDWLTEQQHAYRSGTYISPKQAERPFSDVIDAWRESAGLTSPSHLSSQRLSPTTAAGYISILDLYVTPTFGHQAIGQITHEAVQRWVNTLAQEHAPGTTRNVFAVLRNVFNKGVKLGMVRTSPCANVDLPRSPREEMLCLTAGEVSDLANAIDPYYRTLVYFAAYTGLRAGEQLALQRQDVNLTQGTVAVRRARREVSGHITYGPTKTQGSRRTVSLPAFLTTLLREHMANVPLNPDALVFTGKSGKPLRHNTFVKRHFKPAVRAALPPHLHGLRWHDLRHTAASLAIAAGAHPKLIQARLGHASVTITLDRYGHLMPGAEQSLGEALDALHATADAATETTGTVTELRR